MSTKITLLVTTSLLALAAADAHAHGSNSGRAIFIPKDTATSASKSNQVSNTSQVRQHLDTAVTTMKPQWQDLHTTKVVKAPTAPVVLDVPLRKTFKNDAITAMHPVIATFDPKTAHQLTTLKTDPKLNVITNLQSVSVLKTPATATFKNDAITAMHPVIATFDPKAAHQLTALKTDPKLNVLTSLHTVPVLGTPATAAFKNDAITAMHPVTATFDPKAAHQLTTLKIDPKLNLLTNLHPTVDLKTPATANFLQKGNFVQKSTTWSNDLNKAMGHLNFAKAQVDPVQAQKFHLAATKFLETAPNGTITAAKIDHFITLNKIAGKTAVISAAEEPGKVKSVLAAINSDVASGQVKIVPITNGQTSGTGPGKAPAGDNSTIVIDKSENGKTVYVPASQLSGPDKRTIEVDCKNCKVVVVGDNAGSGTATDDRKIIVNGNGDKVVAQGDTANGTGAGQSGGQITDARQIIVNGNKDKISDGGDTSMGVAGASGGTHGQAGGSGGTITDDRSVVVNGNKDNVVNGTDQVAGGRGGDGTVAGGNGGFGGTINDNRTADINGNSNSVTMGGSTLKGGDGGNGGGGFGGNGGDGGRLTDNRGGSDNGKHNSVTMGDDTGFGGNGGNGTLGP